ncbi:MAG: hypothetical protein AB7N90_17295, partial [Vicinamibacterales bacterium]
GDWQAHPGGVWGHKPADLLCAYLPNMHPAWEAQLAAAGLDAFYEGGTVEEWLATRPFLPAPYPGQDVAAPEIDLLAAAEFPPRPYAVFRGFYWRQRLPFIRHLRDIVRSRGLKEIVLISSKAHPDVPPEFLAPVNLATLPEPFRSTPSGTLAAHDYLGEIAHATASLSLPGLNDVSRRDIESLGLGVPVIRPGLTVDVWGFDDCPALIETRRCMAFACDQHVNWTAPDDDLVRQSCEDMVEAALALIADPAELVRRKHAARAWYEHYCDPEVVADYLFGHLLDRFGRDFTTNWARYDGALRDWRPAAPADPGPRGDAVASTEVPVAATAAAADPGPSRGDGPDASPSADPAAPDRAAVRVTASPVGWDTFDIWYTPRGGIFVEERCAELLAARFAARFGARNVRLRASPWEHTNAYTQLCPESVVVEHPFTGRWAMWHTGDRAAWAMFTTMFRRVSDWGHYPGAYWRQKPVDLVCGLVASMNVPAWRAHLGAASVDDFYDGTTLDGWLATDPFAPCPYPGQDIHADAIDELFAREIPPEPYAVFRGFYWHARLPFLAHLRDIVRSRRLTEIVLISSKADPDLPDWAHEPINAASLPPRSRAVPFGNLPRDEYLVELAHASACLALPGVNDVARREVEALALGVPVIRPAYTVDIWGTRDCEAIVETTRCMDYQCGPHTNWRVPDDDLVRQCCEEMVDAALALIADPARLRRAKRAARAWYEAHCRPDAVADYLFEQMTGRFARDFAANWAGYDGALREG